MHSLISKEKIQKKSEEFGFDIIKITEPEIHKKDHRYIKDFLNNNFHGDMDWLEKNLERRLFPKKIWPDVKSIIVLGVNYAPDHDLSLIHI